MYLNIDLTQSCAICLSQVCDVFSSTEFFGFCFYYLLSAGLPALPEWPKRVQTTASSGYKKKLVRKVHCTKSRFLGNISAEKSWENVTLCRTLFVSLMIAFHFISGRYLAQKRHKGCATRGPCSLRRGQVTHWASVWQKAYGKTRKYIRKNHIKITARGRSN